MGKLMVIALTLSLNNFAVSLALGALGQARKRWRIALAFGSFEFLVPLVGIWIGSALSTSLTTRAGWVGALFLGAVGAWTLVSGIRRREPAGEPLASRAATWTGLVALAGALSIDNLVVGLGLGLRGFPPVLLAGTIAGMVVLSILVGLHLGSAARRHWERRAEIAAGGLLIALAGAMGTGWI